MSYEGRCKKCGAALFVDDWGALYAISASLKRYFCDQLKTRKHRLT